MPDPYHDGCGWVKFRTADLSALLSSLEAREEAERERDAWRKALEELRAAVSREPDIAAIGRTEFLLALALACCEESERRVETLRDALQASMSWLASYPGGLSRRAYEQAKEALSALSQEKGK